jgi:hypothetical protein
VSLNDHVRVAEIAAFIERHRFSYANEDDLQAGLAAALAPSFDVEREVRLTSRSRIDLLVDDHYGIEVKVAGTADALVRQVSRYSLAPQIRGLIVVTSRIRHLDVPPAVNGKPLVVVSLAGAAL